MIMYTNIDNKTLKNPIRHIAHFNKPYKILTRHLVGNYASTPRKAILELAEKADCVDMADDVINIHVKKVHQVVDEFKNEPCIAYGDSILLSK